MDPIAKNGCGRAATRRPQDFNNRVIKPACEAQCRRYQDLVAGDWDVYREGLSTVAQPQIGGRPIIIASNDLAIDRWNRSGVRNRQRCFVGSISDWMSNVSQIKIRCCNAHASAAGSARHRDRGNVADPGRGRGTPDE